MAWKPREERESHAEDAPPGAGVASAFGCQCNDATVGSSRRLEGPGTDEKIAAFRFPFVLVPPSLST
jgi:hypothetical protein